MTTSKIGQLKPFMIEEKKEGPTRSVSEVTANKWQGCMLANIRKEEKWNTLIEKTWKTKKTENRGIEGAEAAATSAQVDLMLEYISQYAPNALYRDITLRATSLTAVWTLVRNWAGLKTSGCKQHTYYTVKHSFDPNGDLTPTDFFFSLRNAKEDCLLLSATSGGNVKFHGSIPTENEDLTPTLESDVVLDWLDALGKTQLVEHTFRVFAKELETESLADLRQRISNNLSSLMAEADQQVEISRAFVPQKSYSNQNYQSQPQRRFSTPPFTARPQPRYTLPPTPTLASPHAPGPSAPSIPCKLCLLNKPTVAYTHSIATCSQLNLQERQQVSRAVLTTEEEKHSVGYNYPVYEEAADDEEEYLPDDTEMVKTCLAQVTPGPIVRINRVNITESPILALSCHSRTIYLVLDTGATASIITLKMAKLLNLPIYRTGHSAVQVDGESHLPVLGEVHTTFTRGSRPLHFSGLVVSQLGVDILAGTNFHVENDVYSRMSKGTIHIGDTCTIQSSPPSLLTLDMLDTRSKQRLVKIPHSTTLQPGDSFTISAPCDIPPDSFVMLEPNLQQTSPFFSSSITQLQEGSFTVKNQTADIVHSKKNCQAFSLYTTSSSNLFSPSNPHPLDIPPVLEKTQKDIVSELTFDGSLSSKDKAPFLNSIAKLPSPLLKQVDFASRNPVDCSSSSCTICKDSLPAAILAVSLPTPDLALASVSAWKDIQQSCPDLRRVHALLMSGRNLSKKERKAEDVRTYLRKCTLNKKGLIVSLQQLPFHPKPVELIVIPHPYAFTFSKALHVQLNHPLPSQMRKQFSRQYFMLDEAKTLQKVFDSCDVPCQASRILPKEVLQFSTDTKPEKLGQFFNADVMEESSQKILVIRENLTSFTDCLIIKSQTKHALREAIIVLTSRLKLGDNLSVRVDGQSSLSSLRKDKSLEPLGIFLDVGQPKNVNKNATADKAIRELREQLVRLSPHGGAVSEATLARATAFLNSTIRHTGRSAKELWLSRDQCSGANIQLDDQDISDKQFTNRQSSHLPSSKYSSRNGKPVSLPSMQIGDMVYVKSDRSKSKARDSFMITHLNDNKKMATVQKFPMSHFRHHPIDVQYQNLYPTTANKPTTTTQTPALPPAPHPEIPIKSPPLPKPPRYVITTTPTYTQDSDSDEEDSNPDGSWFPGRAWGVLKEELAYLDLSSVKIVLPNTSVSSDELEDDTIDSDDDNNSVVNKDAEGVSSN